MIQIIVEERRQLLEDFLNRWPIETVRNMQLSEYNHLHSFDTFCYWLEHKANDVGSIKGLPQTVKFGIYNHNDASETIRKKNLFDNKYAWLRSFGLTRKIAFDEIKKEILKIIEYSTVGNFKAIDDLRYTSFAKWKIAFMYSNERIIPIFKWGVLKKIAEHFGEKIDKNTPVSRVQEVIMSNKPPKQNVFEYTYELWFKFSGKHAPKARRGRKGVDIKDTKSQKRSGSVPYIATQKHNIIQNLLIERLRTEHGRKNVFMEENNIDIKVHHSDGTITYYEVKGNSYAAGCVEEALGQILAYCHYDISRKKKYKIVIVGQYPPFEIEVRFINYVKGLLSIDLDYEYIPLS